MAISKNALDEARKRAKLRQQGSGASGPISETYIRSLAGDTEAIKQFQSGIDRGQKDIQDRKRTSNSSRRTSNSQNDLISLNQKQGNSMLKDAQKRRLVGLSEARTSVGDTAQNQRVAEKVKRRKEAGKFNKFILATGGLTGSGADAQGELARGVVQQQAETDIGLNEANQLSQLGIQEQQSNLDFETGKNQLGFETTAARIKQSQQEQANRDALALQQNTQQFDIAEDNRIREVEFQNTLELRQFDSAIQQARDTGNFAQEQQLINQRAQRENEQIRLREAVKGTAEADKGVTSNTFKSIQTGTDRLVDRIDEAFKGGEMTIAERDAQVEILVERQVAAMVQRGATEEQVRDFIASYGIETTTGLPTQTGINTGQVR